MKNKVKSAILGLAVADALGVPVKFSKREDLKDEPVVDMQGNGTHHQPEGTWSDDTSMTLCMMDSLKDGLNYDDIMNKFLNFLEKGDYTAGGTVFDLGVTCKQAIISYKRGRRSLECGAAGQNDNGNGSLMRILPVAFYIIGTYGYEADDNTIFTIVHNMSGLTHRHLRSQIACGIYTMIAIVLLKEGNLQFAIHEGIERAFAFYSKNRYTREEVANYKRLRSEHFKELEEAGIRSSGYVVDTLEAAIWCLLTTNTYKGCVLKAVNLGGDTDTIAAVAGGLAGIAYGIKGIPEKWLDVLAKKDFIEQVCYAFTESIYTGNSKLLTSYKEQLEKDDIRGKSETAFAYAVYDSIVTKFIEQVKNTCYWTTHYIGILKKENITITNDLKEKISTADDLVLGAILTGLIRQERFNDGLIACSIQNGTMGAILDRLEEIHG